MRIGIATPIPVMGSIPGPSRPGWGPTGSYDFQFEVAQGQVGITVLPRIGGQGFTVKWQNGTEQFINAGTTNLQSPTTDAGIISINKKTDQGFCDDFAVVSGKEFVTKVISWGQNPWNRLQEAFKDCTNLTDISTTSLITGSGCVLSSAFQSCTSLAEVNISSWDMTNAARIDQMFDACTGLEVFETGSLNLNLNHASRWWLRGTGTAVTNGCEYKMNGLNITATSYAASNMTSWWVSMKINPSSSFANISWPSATHPTASFSSSSITGVNSTLDCSGWTNYNSGSFPSFSSVIATEGGASNMKIDITNLSVSNITSFNRSFLASNVSEIIGLSSLGASAGMTNMEFAFYLCGFLNFSNNNFSNAFINSFSLTSAPTQAFKSVGASLSSGSAPPNLGSLNISGVSALTQMFQSAKFSSAPDFSNVVMSTTNPYDLNNCFSGMAILDTSNIDSLFAKTFKVSSFQSTFNNCQISSITIGNNVDLSTCTTFNRAFLSASTISDVSFPTNADFSGVTTNTNYEYMFLAGPTLSTCSVDNFIRRLHATALSYGLVVNFYNAATTEAPSVVSSKVADLEAAGWTITDNTTDATLPFAYPSYSFDSEVTQSVTPSTIPSGGQFSSTDPGVTVNSSTGVVSWTSTYMGLPVIRCTYADGCYNEVQMSMLVTVDNNYSMEFDGINSYIDIGSQTFNSDNSISFWINRSTSSNYGTILSTNSNYSISLDEGGGIIGVGKFYFRINSVNYTVSSTALATGTWSHVVFAINGTNVYCYINGVLDKTTTVPAYSTWQYIGSQGAGVGNLFTGKLDEIGIFNRTLTASQIKLIYDANSTNKSIKLSSLPGGAPVVWYRMGD